MVAYFYQTRTSPRVTRTSLRVTKTNLPDKYESASHRINLLPDKNKLFPDKAERARHIINLQTGVYYQTKHSFYGFPDGLMGGFSLLLAITTV